MMRRGQGLPLSTIVVAALALLVLVAIATFVTGGFSKLFGGMSRVAPSTVDSWRTSCRTACSELKTAIAGESFQDENEVWSYICSSKFVSMSFNYSGQTVHCYQSPINVQCKVEANLNTGTTIIVTVDRTQVSQKCGVTI